MAQSWFYQTSEGQQSGPVDSRELRRLAEAGIVTSDTLVRKGASGRWARAENVRGLFQRSTPVPSSAQLAVTLTRNASKLYISAVVALVAVGALVVIASATITAHDQLCYRQLSANYRTGIEKLQQEWHYAGLREDERQAISDQHQRWVDEEKLEWWGADTPVRLEGQQFVDDLDQLKRDALENFRRLVPRWGHRLHQQHPFGAIAISLLAFIPLVTLLAVATWLRWVQSPVRPAAAVASAPETKKGAEATPSAPTSWLGAFQPGPPPPLLPVPESGAPTRGVSVKSPIRRSLDVVNSAAPDSQKPKESGDLWKLSIAYGVTGIVLLLAVPVLGWERVVEIAGETTAGVIITMAVLSVPWLLWSLWQRQIAPRGTSSSTPGRKSHKIRRSPAAANRNSMAVASAVIGFIGLASIPLALPFVGILGAVGAIGLGIFGLKSEGRRWAIVGIVCGCLTVLFVVAAVALVVLEHRRYEDLIEKAVASANAPVATQEHRNPFQENATPAPLPASDPAADGVGQILSQASVHMDAGDYDRAIADCTEAIRLDPTLAAAYHRRGTAYLRKSDLDRAIADYTQAIQLDPRAVSAYESRGMVYRLFKRDLDRAIADYTQAIRVDPEAVSAYESRGLAYLDKEDYDSAIVDFSEAIRLDPEKGDLYFWRGLAYHAKRDYDTAIVDFSEAIRLDPKDPTGYGHRGRAYCLTGDYDSAISDCTQAIRIDPENADAYFARSVAYDLKGQRAAAERDLAKAKELGYKP